MATEPAATVEQIAADLEDIRRRLDELSPENAGVRAAFAVSVDHLDTELQDTFHTIGAYPGATLVPSIAAAIMDLPLPEANRRLRQLAASNLLQPIDPDLGETPRYELHDLIRDFARELADVKLGPSGRETISRRLTTAYRTLAKTGPWQHIAAERNNLTAFAEHNHGDELVASALLAFDGTLLNLGYPATARTLITASMDLYTAGGNQHGRASAHVGLGDLDRLAGRADTARQHYQTALDLYVATGNQLGQADAHLVGDQQRWPEDPT